MHRQRCSHPLGSTIGLNSIFLYIISDNFTYPYKVNQSQPKIVSNRKRGGFIFRIIIIIMIMVYMTHIYECIWVDVKKTL